MNDSRTKWRLLPQSTAIMSFQSVRFTLPYGVTFFSHAAIRKLSTGMTGIEQHAGATMQHHAPALSHDPGHDVLNLPTS